MPMHPALALLAALVGPARAASVDFECVPDEGDGIVGLSPLTVSCGVLPPSSGSYEVASWTFGDGTVLYGENVSYTYVDPGQYNVSVLLEGYEDASGAEEAAPRRVRYGYVTVCDEPRPEFSYRNKGGLDLQIVNETAIAVHCLDSLVWELFRGLPTGAPVETWEIWEPRFELPEEGLWTLRLTMHGLGGTRSVEERIEARYKLTDDLTERPAASACATGPGSAGSGAGLLAGLLLLGRRR